RHPNAPWRTASFASLPPYRRRSVIGVRLRRDRPKSSGARQSGCEKCREELASHVGLEAGSFECLHDPRLALEELRRIGNASDRRHRQFLKNHDATGPQMTGEPPQGGGRIRQIHQDEPPDDRVESFVGNETVEVGDRKPYPSTDYERSVSRLLPMLRD